MADEEEVFDCSRPEVVTKYRVAGDIANLALQQVISLCVAGAKVHDICAAGDATINQECAKVYKKDKFAKGLSFPTCLNIGLVCAHFSPLKDDTTELKTGDVVKIDLGAHIDGFIGRVGHTIVVGAGTDASPATGRVADTILAAHNSAQVLLRCLRPGIINHKATELITKVLDSYDVTSIEGNLSHTMGRFNLDGTGSEKAIIAKAQPERRMKECTFVENEVYFVDIVVTTGAGKASQSDEKPTLFRATENECAQPLLPALQNCNTLRRYQLKVKAAKTFLTEAKSKFGVMPFSLRDIEMGISAVRLGEKELMEHELMEVFPVIHEKAGLGDLPPTHPARARHGDQPVPPPTVTASTKFTVLMLKSGPVQITGHTTALPVCRSEHAISDKEVVDLLATEVRKKPEPKAKK
jgi:curved DNA binding protein